MWHLHDLLAIVAAFAVILVVLTYGDLLDSRSLLWRTLSAPTRVIGKVRRREPPRRP
jgi:hypothetical protein